MSSIKEDIIKILKELRDRSVEELVTYDLKRDWKDFPGATPWEVMCHYKKEENTAGDCDVSLRSMVIYWLVFGFEEWRIRPYYENYQLGSASCKFTIRGDTMNSYATTAHAYLRMKGMETVRGNRTWYDAILNDRDKFAPLFQGGFAAFIRVCHTVGNMLPIPSGELNRARAFGPTRDYFDLFLTWMFEFFDSDHPTPMPGCLHTGAYFAGKLFGGLWELMDCLQAYDSWDNYVCRNYLEDFCWSCEKNGEVHFSGGRPLWPDHRLSGGAMPKTEEDCETFFENATRLILARGHRIIHAVKDKLDEYEKNGHTLEELAEEMTAPQEQGDAEKTHTDGRSI